MAAIKIENLYLGYDEKTVVSDFCSDLKKSEIISIIGPNGSGKSTVLKAVAKLLKPQKGAVYVDKKCIGTMSNKEVANKMSVLLQYNSSPSDISVRDLIYFGRMPHKKWYESRNNEDEKVINQAIKNTNLTHLQDKKVACLSGGERQRVWLAVALAQEPDILLLDEPTTYLDIGYQLELLELVKDLNQNLGMTVIMVLHDLNQAAKYSDTIIVLDKGEIVEVGRPKAVLTHDILNTVYKVEASIYFDKHEDYPIIIPRKVI